LGQGGKDYSPREREVALFGAKLLGGNKEGRNRGIKGVSLAFTEGAIPFKKGL